MRLRVVTFTAAIAGAALAAGGVLVLGGAPTSARADLDTSADEAAAHIDELLAEVGPGAVVRKQEDGSISVHGRATPIEENEIRESARLADAGPNSIRCAGTGAMLTCTPVPDADVVQALKSGDTLYGRTVYRGIRDATIDDAPLFESGELVCGDAKRGTIICSRVDHVPPVIAVGESFFVTYKPYHVTFENGTMRERAGRPIVPLVRAQR
jgi:hypothetical protein